MRLLKALMTGSFLFLCTALIALAWLVASPVTAGTVATRLVQGCLVSNTATFADTAKARAGAKQSWRGLQHCRCISEQIVDIFGHDRAGDLADAMRLQLAVTLKSMVSGNGIEAARGTPYVTRASRLVIAAGHAERICRQRTARKIAGKSN